MGHFLAHGGGDRIGGSSYQPCDEILVDFGAIQQEGRQIKLPYIALEVLRAIKLFIVSHAHLDHCFGAAVFARENRNAVILMTRTTRDCIELQLLDSVRIAEKNQRAAQLEGLPIEPLLFTEEDVGHLISRVRCVDDEHWFELPELPGYKFSFRSAGHMPGAAIILVITPEGKRIIHACDYCLNDQALVKGAKIPEDFLHPDLLVTESTYGNKDLPSRASEEETLVRLIRETMLRGGQVVLPYFSSTGLNGALIPARAGVPVWIDGMIRDFWRVYRNATPWSPNDISIEGEVYDYLTCVDGDDPRGDYNLRRRLMESGSPFCVFSSSGRLQGGPSVGYVEEALKDSRNMIIIAGHQGDESIGGQLLRLTKGDQITFSHERMRRDRVERWSETHQINCEVVQLRLSGHSDGNAMADWICRIDPRMVITVHGDPLAQAGLAKRIYAQSSKIRVESGINGKVIEF